LPAAAFHILTNHTNRKPFTHLSKDDVSVRVGTLEHVWGLDDEENLWDEQKENYEQKIITSVELVNPIVSQGIGCIRC
jgi:hypothetical protein